MKNTNIELKLERFYDDMLIQRNELLAAIQEIARLRLATDEGSLRVRADRIWDVAVTMLRKAENWTEG